MLVRNVYIYKYFALTYKLFRKAKTNIIAINIHSLFTHTSLHVLFYLRHKPKKLWMEGNELYSRNFK